MVALVVALALAAGWTVFVTWGADRSDAAAPAHAVARRCVPPNGNMTCEQWARHKARQFRQGKLGDSRAGHLTKPMKKAITRWYNHHPKAKKREMREDGYRPVVTSDGRVVARGGDWCSWCDFIFDAGECMVYGWAQPYRCNESNDEIHAAQQNVERVLIGCGGSALIVYRVAGGAQSAIGAGILSCAWQLYNDKVVASHVGD